MRILRNVLLSIAIAALATACGGKSAPATTPDTTGDTSDDGMGGDSYGEDGMGGDPCGDDMSDPCEGAD